MTRLREIRSGQDGIAMVVAMGVLTVLLILTGTAIVAAGQLSSATGTETMRKRAFEAADAGLQATVYRLNMLAPSTDRCIGGPNSAVMTPTSGAACDAYDESLGNGGSYSSNTTRALGAGDRCAGYTISAASTIVERCVTSRGTVEGVTRRVQARVASYASAPVFPVAGLLGLDGIELSNNAVVNGGLGSNGEIELKNNARASSTTIGPSAPSPSVDNNADAGTISRRTTDQGPFALAPVNPGNSATVNDNSRLTNGAANPRVSPYDSLSGSVSWNPTTRSLRLSNNAAVTLGGALYNLCSLTMSNNSKITLAAGARTAIYIDSPARSGSGCPSGSGTFSMSNNAGFVNNTPAAAGSSFAYDPTALQIYVVGQGEDDDDDEIKLSNNTAFYGLLYAPTSKVELSNNARTWGAISAREVEMKNNATFNGDPNATAITTSGGGLYYRTAWRECRPAATTSDPGSGC